MTRRRDPVIGALARELRARLVERAVPADAEPMRAYMKSEIPFLGVKTPGRRAACKEAFGAHLLGSRAQWERAVRTLWARAEFREEQHCAIELAGYRAYADYRTLDALPLYEHLVVEGAWWDYVDAVSTQQLWQLFRTPAGMARRMRAWAKDANVWKRRASITCQIKRKADTDFDLLVDCIRPSIGERSFWLRKGIGWALREHARTDAEAVIAFVGEHRGELSPLSKREALRNLVKEGRLDSIP